MNRQSTTPVSDRFDRLMGRLLDFCAGAGFVAALIAASLFFHR